MYFFSCQHVGIYAMLLSKVMDDTKRNQSRKTMALCDSKQAVRIVTVPVRLTPALHARMKAAARDRGMTMQGALLRGACRLLQVPMGVTR